MDREDLSGQGALVKQIRKRKGLKQKQLAALLEVTDDVVSNIERGITPLTKEMREKVATALGCTPDDLKPWRGTEQQTAQQPAAGDVTNVRPGPTIARAGWRLVPIYGALSAGAPGYTLSDVIEWEEMPEWGGDFERWGRVIVGDSMNPEFEDGDVAIFESRGPDDGHGVHAFRDGDETFKIFRVMGDTRELWPSNTDPAYMPFSALDWDIRGVCIRRIRRQTHGIRDIREYPQGFRWRFRP